MLHREPSSSNFPFLLFKKNQNCLWSQNSIQLSTIILGVKYCNQRRLRIKIKISSKVMQTLVLFSVFWDSLKLFQILIQCSTRFFWGDIVRYLGTILIFHHSDIQETGGNDSFYDDDIKFWCCSWGISKEIVWQQFHAWWVLSP